VSFALNISDEEFNRILEDIDESMASQGVNIPARELRGWMLFCERQKLEGINMNHPISKKITDWFRARYGDRLNLDFTSGHSALLLRGDIIRFKCPMFFGRAFIVCCPELADKEFSHLAQPALIDVSKQLVGVTSAYSRSLTLDERNHVLETVSKTEIWSSRVGDAGAQAYIPEGRADLRTSVDQMMLHEPQFGPSKWASLQAVEKFLKAYIKQQGSEPEFTHKLADLADAAESLGLLALKRLSVSLIQCSPSVRYEASSVTKAEAVKAHEAAISICADIATQLKGRSEWRTGALARALLSFDGKAEKVPAILIARTNQDVAFNQEIETN
jgi:hypothetical protein